MSDAQLQVKVNQDSPRSENEGIQAYLKGTKRGELCVIDFYTEMMLEGRAFQCREGHLSVPGTGGVIITDTKAEMAVEAGNGLAVLPTYCHISINVGTGTLHEYAVKSVDGAITTLGTAFTPLPLMTETNAAASRARCGVNDESGVTVVLEAVDTTRAHWHVSNPLTVGAGHSVTNHYWEPRTPPVIANGAHVYVQIACVTAGPDYYAALEWIELPWVSIS